MSSASQVTRFAPSPTGHLHLGNARTALLNYLAARKVGGRFILRVEDTDEARSTQEFMDSLVRDLKWLGLDWDEGPDIGGPHASYRQQERREIYAQWLAKLDEAQLTYPCFCTPAELNIARKQQLAAGKPPRYAGTCRNLTEAERAERLARGQQAALRFRVPAGEIVEFDDVVHGRQRFNTDDIGDFIIRRADGTTAFFFSNALDDALMGVTLVLRGDDHMTNTPRQILLLRAMGLPVPHYAHVALLLGMDGAPLSKRNGALSLQELRERGFLPGAIRNHLVRLGHTCATDGWLDEAAMARDFDLQRLGRAAAKFDQTQLLHWQREAVAHLSLDEFRAWTADQLPPGVEEARLLEFLAAVRRNVEFRGDVAHWAHVVFGRELALDEAASAAVREAGAAFFQVAREVLARDRIEFKQAAREIGQTANKKGPALYMPLRAALTGATHGPELAPLLTLIPSEEVQRRLERAAELAR
jgi:glutamyl-tRNA synthetase